MFRIWNQRPGEKIKSGRIAFSLILILLLATRGSPFDVYPAVAVVYSAKRAERIRKAENLAKVAAVFFQRLLKAEDGISTTVLREAKAVAVFPVVSGSKGFLGLKIKADGVISRRVGPVTWTAPAFFEINRSSGPAIKGSTSTVVLVLKGDNAVDRLRTSNFGDLRGLNVVQGPIKENSKEPSLVTSEGKPLYSDSNAFYYEYVDGVPVTPASLDASIKSKDSFNEALYENKSKDVLFDKKKEALDIANEPGLHSGLYAFKTAVDALPPNDDMTPKLNEFFDAGNDYSIEKSLETIKGHMKYYLNSQGFSYREEATDDGVIITTFQDLEDRGRRRRRAAFLIKIIRTNQVYYCNVQFRWHVSSRGKDERNYQTLAEDKNITDQDVLLKGYLEQIKAELKKLQDDK